MKIEIIFYYNVTFQIGALFYFSNILYLDQVPLIKQHASFKLWVKICNFTSSFPAYLFSNLIKCYKAHDRTIVLWN